MLDADASHVKYDNNADKTVCNKRVFGEVDGFSDEDLEKPNFPGKQSLEKVPFFLSDVDNPPIVQVPATINQYLRPYQKEGIAFLYRQYSSGKGAILADDMGLGKTVQVIGFISAILGKSGTKMDIYGKFISERDKNKVALSQVRKEHGTFLIVSPNSVLYNWHDELMTWGYFKVGKFHKNKRDETLERAALGKLDVVLTTYETLRNHWETLNRIKWLAVIMDEVHHLKDPKRAITIASKSLNVNCRIGLTGTPMQNRLLDFWSVLDWANPSCLGDKQDFAYDFGRPIMHGQRFDGTKRELATGRKKTHEFQSMIDSWCLRRTKALIADQLPQKEQKVVFCPLSKLQEDIYKIMLQTNDVQLVLKQGEACDCRSGLTRGMCCYSANDEGSSMKKLLLQCLRLFLKVSNHAALLLPHVKQTEDQRQRAKTLCEKVFKVHPEFERASKSPSFELFADSNFCGKMKVLDKLLKLFLRQKDKVLLFSYSTQLLDMLEAYVISCGMVYRRLDGKTRGERRLDVVREFNTNPDIFVFLVSTKAGGVGLNLTSANIVIVFDPSWNPADDLQAEDRAYRIGQRRDVKVFRLISSGTVEENIYLRQIYKQQLANIAVEGNNERRYFTAVDGEKDKKGELFGIENLFALRNYGCSVSTDIFKRSDKIEREFRVVKYELQPQEVTEQKMIGQESADATFECVGVEEDENSYDLKEITSQFIGEETTNLDCLACNSPKEDSPGGVCYDDVANCKDLHMLSNSKVVRNEKRRFTKLLDKPEKHVPPSPCDEKQKRQKQSSSYSSKPISKDSQVNKILEECGVLQSHSNKMIIGTSEAENEMTSRAIREVFDLGQYSQQPANCVAAVESDGEESDDIGDHNELESNPKTERIEEKNNFQEMKNNTCSFINKVQTQTSVSKADGHSIIFGKTPKTIRLRQFTEISRAHGFESEVEFARAVIKGNTAERLGMLMEYYKTKEYPSESISLLYSQSNESSQDLNISDSKGDKTFTLKKTLASSTTRQRSLPKQKSFVKKEKRVRVVRSYATTSKTNRIAKKRRNCSKVKITAKHNANADNSLSNTADKEQQVSNGGKPFESCIVENIATISSARSIVRPLGNISDNLQLSKDQLLSCGSHSAETNSCFIQKFSEDKSLSNTTNYNRTKSFEDNAIQPKSYVSSAANDQASQDILSEILTVCCDKPCAPNIDPSPALCETGSTSNTSSIPERSQGSQSSTFLDEFLFECSQRIPLEAYNSSPGHVSQSNNTCVLDIQTSVIDDLI